MYRSIPFLARRLPAQLLVLALLAFLSAPAAWAQLTFEDVAAGGGAGIDYHRIPSDRDALFDAIKQKPFFTFTDQINFPHHSRGVPGVAIFDHDGDGDLDVYVTNGPGANNSLYSNQLVETGAVTFVDVAAAAGVGAFDQDSDGVCYGDIDNDGDQDLMVLGFEAPNRLFENQGDGTFLDVSVPSGVADAGAATSISCSMGDVDGDGLLDVVIGNAFDMTISHAIYITPFDLNQHNQLLHNQGGNTFVDVSASSGILDLGLPPEAPAGAATITWAIALVDVDLDGDLDLVQGDDQASIRWSNIGGIDRGLIQMFENDGSGHFTNVTYAAGLNISGAWMGLSFGDFDRDGLLDLFASNFGNHTAVYSNGPRILTLNSFDSRWFLRQADGSYDDASGLGAPQLHTPFGWGTSTADYDNDGDTDILYHGGHDVARLVITSPGVILANDGDANFQRDATALAGSTDHVRRNAKGVAVGDLDDNGFFDIVSASSFDFPDPPLTPSPALGSDFDADAAVLLTFTPIDLANFIWQWLGLTFPDGSLSVELSSGDNGNGWVKAELIGSAGVLTGGTVNRDGIGAVVTFTPDGDAPSMRPVVGGASYASQDALEVGFGLGDAQAGTFEVLWPGGIRNRLYDVAAGERVRIPHVPCAFDGDWPNFGLYNACVMQALNGYKNAGLITPQERNRLRDSANRAFDEAH